VGGGIPVANVTRLPRGLGHAAPPGPVTAGHIRPAVSGTEADGEPEYGRGWPVTGKRASSPAQGKVYFAGRKVFAKAWK
jgi:hypothetical protein